MRIYEFNNRVLLEYSREITAKNFGGRLLAIARKDNSFFSNIDVSMDPHYNIDPSDMPLDLVLDSLEEADPTPNKQYVQTLARWYIQGNIKFEDLESRGSDALQKFELLKRRNLLDASLRDIGKYKTFQQFENTIGQLEIPEPEMTDKGKAYEHYNDAELRIILPVDEQAAKYYGQGTTWCTAATNNNMFDRYYKGGPLYIIIPKHPEYLGEKYQLQFESSSYMDEKDQPISLYTLAENFPQLRTVFKKQAEQFKVFGLLYANVPEHTMIDLEDLLVGDLIKNNFGLHVYHAALKAFQELFAERWWQALVAKHPNAFEKVQTKLLALVNDRSTETILLTVARRINIMESILLRTDGFWELQESLMDVINEFMNLSNGLSNAIKYIRRFIPDTDDDMEAIMEIEHEMTSELTKSIKAEADKIIKFNLDQYRVQQ